MVRHHLLVIEDDEDITELVHYNFTREGYQVTCRLSGEEGLTAARTVRPDLILLDLMLPGIDGLEVCRQFKQDERTRHIPIVMLTAKGEEPDIVAGLELGADDYIPKPFSPKVLVARVRAVLRRREMAPAGSDAVLTLRELTIDPHRREVLLAGDPLELTFTEFSVLHLLAQRPGWVYTRYQIVDSVRGEEYAVTERAVDVQISGLRKKLGPAGRCIETVRGVGYRFKE